MILASKLHKARVAWYPSAGTDFRPILYLHPDYQSQCNVPKPDIYLFSDILDFPSSKFISGNVLHEDSKTKLTALSVDYIGILKLPVRPELVPSSNPHQFTNHLYKIHVQIESTELERSSVTVYYAFCENTALANYLIGHRVRVSHLIRVCYGSAFGGSAASGAWLLNTTQALRTECMISDKVANWYYEPSDWREADDFAVKYFRHISTNNNSSLELVDQASWGTHSTYWYKLSHLDNEN